MQDNLTYLYAPLTKRDAATRMVEGAISGNDNLDLDKQIVDASFLRRVVGPWFKFGNIREQHIPTKAVGKAKTVDVTADGVPFITAKIVDDAAWAKVEEGVYSGFSVGIKNARIVRDPDAPNGRIVDGDLVEVSIVDHPANPEAKFAICKAAKSGGWVDLQSGVVIESNMPATDKPNLPKAQEDDNTKKMPDTDTTPTSVAAAPATTPLATDEEYKSVEAGLTKGFTHTHHYLDDSATPVHGPHTHDKGGSSDVYGMSAPYAEHKHCRTCGNDDRMCGHGKKSMKDAGTETSPSSPDVSKAEQNVVQEATPLDGQGASPNNNLLQTQGNPVMDLLHNAQSALAALASAVGQTASSPDPLNSTSPTHQSAFASHISTPAQSWSGGSMFDLKAAVSEALKELLPDLVQKELGKSFGDAGLLTKGATPDAVKAAVISIAESAAAAAIEPIEKRLETVEEMAAPVHGAASTRDVEKSFAGNRDKGRMTIDEIAKMAQSQLTETQRMELTKAAIAEAQRQPSKLFR